MYEEQHKLARTLLRKLPLRLGGVGPLVRLLAGHLLQDRRGQEGRQGWVSRSAAVCAGAVGAGPHCPDNQRACKQWAGRPPRWCHTRLGAVALATARTSLIRSLPTIVQDLHCASSSSSAAPTVAGRVAAEGERVWSKWAGQWEGEGTARNTGRCAGTLCSSASSCIPARCLPARPPSTPPGHASRHAPEMEGSVQTAPLRQPVTRRRRVMARVSTPAMPSTCSWSVVGGRHWSQSGRGIGWRRQPSVWESDTMLTC